jgi:hypothetical protein
MLFLIGKFIGWSIIAQVHLLNHLVYVPQVMDVIITSVCGTLYFILCLYQLQGLLASCLNFL